MRYLYDSTLILCCSYIISLVGCVTCILHCFYNALLSLSGSLFLIYNFSRYVLYNAYKKKGDRKPF